MIWLRQQILRCVRWNADELQIKNSVVIAMNIRNINISTADRSTPKPDSMLIWSSLIIIMDKVSVCRLSQRVIVLPWTYHFVRAEKFFWTIKAFAKIIVGRLESDICFFFRFCCLPLTSFLQFGVYRVKMSRSRKPTKTFWATLPFFS